jgi:hypothetical protein
MDACRDELILRGQELAKTPVGIAGDNTCMIWITQIKIKPESETFFDASFFRCIVVVTGTCNLD